MNYSDDILQLATTATIWICWCIVHSLLNSDGIIAKAFPRGHPVRPYYRLLYSIGSVITLMLAYWITPLDNHKPLWTWNGPMWALQGACWVVALALGYLSFRLINIWNFFGLTALGIGRSGKESSNELLTSGIYGETRNPQFLAGLLLLWARDLTRTGLVINIILSLYLLAGARVEEKRLSKKFGDEYSLYMSRVPRFIPKRIPPLRSLFRVQTR
jgi:protein-S-isoprenylcysteine O-methyltransferase Ste14